MRVAIRAAAEAKERRSDAGRLGPEWLDALRPPGTDWHKPHGTDALHLTVILADSSQLRV